MRTTSVYSVDPGPLQEEQDTEEKRTSIFPPQRLKAWFLTAPASRVNIRLVETAIYSQSALIGEAMERTPNRSNSRQVVTVDAEFHMPTEKSSQFRECWKAAGISAPMTCRLIGPGPSVSETFAAVYAIH